MVVAVAVGAAALGCKSSDSSPAPSSASSGSPLSDMFLAGSAPAASTVAPPTGLREQILGKANITDAIAVARPLMTNTVGRLDPGSALLSLWASDRLTWDALERVPETSSALFRRDPEAERGKRLCMSGVIQDIRAEKDLAARITDDRPRPLIQRASDTPPYPQPDAGGPSAPADSWNRTPSDLGPGFDWSIPHDGKVYIATLKENEDKPPEGSSAPNVRHGEPEHRLRVEVIAVRSGGSLVDGSEARVCGILTGVTLPATPSGDAVGSGTEHRIVGMFDLPENRGHLP